MGEVEFNKENIDKCLCRGCPVMDASQCIMEKKKKMMEGMGDMLPKPEDFPGMFCAKGVTKCDDFDYNKLCMCPKCDVWKENNLVDASPYYLFCREGKPKFP